MGQRKYILKDQSTSVNSLSISDRFLELLFDMFRVSLCLYENTIKLINHPLCFINIWAESMEQRLEIRNRALRFQQ